MPKEINASVIHQWLPEWDNFQYDKNKFDRKPKKFFLMFSLPAKELLKLSRVYRRVDDPIEGLQRSHEFSRSEIISRYVRNGYPACDNPRNVERSFFKPGWLPTAIVANILEVGDKRKNTRIPDKNCIKVTYDSSNMSAKLIIPDEIDENIPPIEIIDGQHRLLAFKDMENIGDDYCLPVVAYIGLDISWQAYIFYTVNISPKKINKSLAYDLYPLLRNMDWLRNTTENETYRTTRAQEIVDNLYSLKSSPWYKNINLLGERDVPGVSQASWITSLKTTFLANSKTSLFSDKEPLLQLSWPRSVQIAYIIFLGKLFFKEYTSLYQNDITNSTYIEDIFKNGNSLLAQDQGIRAFLTVMNKISAENKNTLQELNVENYELFSEQPSNIVIEKIIKEFEENEKIISFIRTTIVKLASFDWRSASAIKDDHDLKLKKSAFRGSSGYKLLREEIMVHCSLA